MDAYSHPEDRRVAVSIEGKDFYCEGLVHLPGIRLSDVMNEKNQFLVVVQAVLTKRNAGAQAQPIQLPTLFINKAEIKYVVPLDERGLSRH